MSPPDPSRAGAVIPRVMLSLLRKLRLAVILALHAASHAELTFHVSPNGNDSTGDGSAKAPWKSIAGARDGIRKSGANANMQENIVVYLSGGRYEIDRTLEFQSPDSATNGKYISYRSKPGEFVSISGGKKLSGWKKVPGKNYWRADIPKSAGFPAYFRQLYVDGIRAERARSGWASGVAYYEDPATPEAIDGITFKATDLKDFADIGALRMLHIGSFKIDEFPVLAIRHDTANGLKHVKLQQPYCQIRYNRKSGYFEARDQWMVVHAFEELDEPGEWYHDAATRRVFYFPHSNEDMNTAVVYVPAVETLMRFQGSASAKVSGLRFQGLVFEHGNWAFPRDHYIGGGQAEAIHSAPPVKIDYEVPGQIILNHTDGIVFRNNLIRHLGSCGIHLYNGALNTTIEGNVFTDLSAAAVLGGRWKGNWLDNDIPDEAHCANTLVRNNVIRGIGMDFQGGTGVNNLCGSGFQVVHNDVADTSYMGIHQRNCANTVTGLPGIGRSVITANKVTLANAGSRYGVGDAGYIYTFGSWPGSVIERNYIHTTYLTNGDVNGLYLDNDTSGFVVRDNVIRHVKRGSLGYKLIRAVDPATVIAENNYGDAFFNIFKACRNKSYHAVENDAWPAEAKAIMDAAGLEPAYASLLSNVHSGYNLALGKRTTASAQSDANSPASAAVDYDYTTAWQSKSGDGARAWWAIDLEAPHVIQRVELCARIDDDAPSSRANFQVQASNDSGFGKFVVLSEQNEVPFAYRAKGLTNSWLKYLNNTQPFRYLRVVKTAPGGMAFSEFQIYGYPPAPD